MSKTGKYNSDERKVADLPHGGFQPRALIVAEIAFAALLLFLTNKPVTPSATQLAQASPLITINIPTANVAVASTIASDDYSDPKQTPVNEKLLSRKY